MKLTLNCKALYMSTQNPIDDLKEIRSMMEKSSRFISLSGLSGVMAGLYAIGGAWAGWQVTKELQANTYGGWPDFADKPLFYKDYFIIAFALLGLSIGTGILLTTMRARNKGQNLWDKTAKRMIMNLSLPLIPGGLLCIAVMMQGHLVLLPALMLIFYGLGLVNGSKYTLHDIRVLGLLDIALGLVAAFKIQWGYGLWVVGFGALHIIYGIYMYLKYERN